MCGYFAFISSKNKQYPSKQFESAFNLLSHRGPDFSKVIYGKKNNFSYQLGHHRLSIGIYQIMQINPSLVNVRIIYYFSTVKFIMWISSKI